MFPLPDTFSARAGGPCYIVQFHCGQSATDEKGMKVRHKQYKESNLYSLHELV